MKNKIEIEWKKKAKRKDYIYYSPVISLIPNDNTAVLKVDIVIEKGSLKPNKIKIVPRNKTAKVLINKKEFSPNYKGDLTIHCTEALKEDLIIDVFADSQICGQLVILKNDETVIQKVKLGLVNVETEINGTKTGEPVSKTELVNFLKQALIILEINTFKLDLTKNLTKKLDGNISRKTYGIIDINKLRNPKDIFKEELTKLKSNGKRKIIKKGLLKFLKSQKYIPLSDQEKSIKDMDYLLFFFDELEVKRRAGTSNKKLKIGACFKEHKPETIPHELVHMMGIPHTFANKSYFTYRLKKTTNLMDYSTKRNHLFYWQWKKINKKIK